MDVIYTMKVRHYLLFNFYQTEFKLQFICLEFHL